MKKLLKIVVLIGASLLLGGTGVANIGGTFPPTVCAGNC
jgi:mannose/fructose/N-acetylgalactosamine-specific phosphotransferase system component IIC